MTLVSCLLTAVLSVTAFGAYAPCDGAPSDSAPPNLNSINEANMLLLSEVENGKLYQAGSVADFQQFFVVHVYGDPYQMGYAQGLLLKDQIISFIDETWSYIESELPLNELFPEFEDQLMKDALQAQADLAAPYTPDYFYEELRGLSDATGLDYDSLLQIHMLPELTKGHCSMFGSTGASNPSGELLQLRALDWDVEGPFKDYPTIIVYHPANNGHVFANIGFNGFIGSITGISSARVSISEIGVSCPDDTWGEESRRGLPFVWLLRDILQFDTSVTNATDRMQNIRRTCNLILGVGSGPDNEFRAYQYNYQTLNVFDDTNMMPYNETWHPRMKNLVYYGMDWWIPGYNQALANQLNDFYGNITVPNAVNYILPYVETGNLHIALYDYNNDDLYVSFHARSNDAVHTGHNGNAFMMPFTRIPLSDLFLEN